MLSWEESLKEDWIVGRESEGLFVNNRIGNDSNIPGRVVYNSKKKKKEKKDTT